MNNRIKRIFQFSLRKRIIVFSIAILLIIVIASYVLINTTVKNNFSRLESTYTILGVNRALDALHDDIYYLSTTCTDWAMWDDTYAFINNPSQSYIDTNLIDETLIQTNLNLIVFADSSNRIVFSKALDLDEKKQTPLPIQEYLVPGNVLLTHNSLDSIISGVILLKDGPMLITSQPILTSAGEGPIRGTLIMGRYLDISMIKQLENRVQQSTSIQPITDISLPDDFQEKIDTSPDKVVVQALDSNTVAGYTVIRDIYDAPILVLRVNMTRDIYQQGLTSTTYLSLAIIALIICSMVVIILTIDRRVLKRVAHINDYVKGIGTTQGTTLTNITLSGSDELTRLGVSISDMLTRLNETKTKLERSENVYRELFEKSQQQYKDEKDLREKLEEEIRKRTELSRALVHELKTPITPVLAGLDLLQDEIHDEHLLQLVQSMDRSATNLNKRIDELLDLARAETNRLEMYFQLVDVKYLLQDIGHAMTAVAKQNGQTMVIDLPPHLPLISADGGRLRQAVENLLTNALKFTPAGGTITLRASIEGDRLIVDIIDTGRGMSEEAQKRLFEPYYRHVTDGQRLSGLGLGLVLSKNFIELQGGEIWVKSQEGKGSTFSFSLPLRTDRSGNKANSPGEQL